MNIYVGVDPGSSGGLIYLLDDGESVKVRGTKMPDTEVGVWEWFEELVGIYAQTAADDPDNPVGIYACIEQVTGYVAKGPRETYAHGGQPGHTMFTFGKGVGSLRMALVASGFREQETFWSPTPGQWQQALGIRTRLKTESDSDWKNHLKCVALALYPKVVVTLPLADALLLAHYCRGKVLGLWTRQTTRAKKAGV